MSKIIANIDNPNIAGCLHSTFEFETEEIADEKIKQLAKIFESSKKQKDKDKYGETLLIWIRDFEVTEQELQKGYVGNFGIIYKVPRENGWTLKLKKVDDIDFKKHPQKARPEDRHPNWGYWALRVAKKKEEFDSRERAEEILELFHKHYPLATIPHPDRLYCMIYNSKTKPIPIDKCTLFIKENTENGTWYLELEMDYKGMSDMNKRKEMEDNAVGAFTKLLATRANKKKKK